MFFYFPLISAGDFFWPPPPPPKKKKGRFFDPNDFWFFVSEFLSIFDAYTLLFARIVWTFQKWIFLNFNGLECNFQKHALKGNQKINQNRISNFLVGKRQSFIFFLHIFQKCKKFLKNLGYPYPELRLRSQLRSEVKPQVFWKNPTK